MVTPDLGHSPVPYRGGGRYATAARYLVAALVVGGVALMFLTPDRAGILSRTLIWVRGAGLAGPVLYAAAYVVATVLLFPGSLISLGAGFVFGPVVGTLIVSPASVIGACLAFLLGRFLVRDWIERRVAERAPMLALDQAIGQGGFTAVVLLRLSPAFPFNLLNYALGLTRVRFRDYALASFVGMLPGTILNVYLGSLFADMDALLRDGNSDGGAWSVALLVVGIAATVAVAALIGRFGLRAFSAIMDRR
jgi:uncharacterized membrane protein YdjX (TVP38/TMEM64 family)